MMNDSQLTEILNGRKKNDTARLTLTIRRHQESFINDLLRDAKSEEEKLEIVQKLLVSLNEAVYEMRERDLASSKVRDDILCRIEQLHVKEFKHWDKEHPEKLTAAIEKTAQKKIDKFSKYVSQMRRNYFTDEMIKKSLKDMGCPNVEEAMK